MEATATQPLYIQYLGSWCVFPQGAEGSAILSKLPVLTPAKSAKIARSGLLFVEFLRDNQLGKLISNLDSMIPEYRAIAINY
jgi:hypothetical protein